MAIMVDDLVGLNATRMQDRPVLTDLEQARRLVTAAASADTSLSMAGMRHTQGGHTAVEDGRMLLTSVALNRISAPWFVADRSFDGMIDVEAGATWEEVQRVLGRHGLAPMVQQSSAHFSIGGSLSVNCHGRDPRWGPVAASVEEISVLTGSGELVPASRTRNPALFSAALGGYGACGLIVQARLRAVANHRLQYIGDLPWSRRSVSDYVEHAHALANRSNVHLHYAWLCCVRDRFYDEVLIADLVYPGYPNRYPPQGVFKEQDWGAEEILRAGWSAARKDPGEMREKVWDQLRRLHHYGGTLGSGGKGDEASRIDWLRSSVSFTADRDAASPDVLQEYFVPIDQLVPMVMALKQIYSDAEAKTNVLSTTLRLVRADPDAALSYCREGTRVSIAVDAEVPTVLRGGVRELHPQAQEAVRAAIRKAVELGGSYYLPYYRVADAATFALAYAEADRLRLQHAIDTYNPRVRGKHRYWNRFLDSCFQ